MRVRITGKKLPKHQAIGPVGNSANWSFDRWWNTSGQQGGGMNSAKPLGYDEQGRAVYPKGTTPMPTGGVEYGSHQGQITATSPAKPFNLDEWRAGMKTKFPGLDFTPSSTPACPLGQVWNEVLGKCVSPEENAWTMPSETNRFEAFKKKKRKEEFPGFDTAAFGLATLGTIDNILNRVEVNNREADRVQQGMTDNKYSSFQNYTPRGYQETNRKLPGSGYTAASFPGRSVAPQFGFAQFGGVMMPGADNPFSQPPMHPVNNATFVSPDDAVMSATPAAPESVEESGPVSENVALESGFVLPVDPYSYKLSSNYGERVHPVTKKKKFHGGVDLGLPKGSNVYSPMDGKVVSVWWDEEHGGGNSVLVEHADGSRTGYAHLEEALVKPGDVVTKGQKIALSGNTGKYTTGPHLHFTYRTPSGEKTDPASVFNFSDYAKGNKKSSSSNSSSNVSSASTNSGKKSSELSGEKRRLKYGIPNPITATEWDNTVQPLSANEIFDVTNKAKPGRFNFGPLESKQAFIIHHTGGRGSVNGVISTFHTRNFPAHYIIDRDGQVHRFLKPGVQGQHMRDAHADDYKGLGNINTEGVEIIAKNDNDILPAQIEAAMRLARTLGYKPSQVLSHGEVNPHKQGTEGRSTIKRIRSQYREEGGEIYQQGGEYELDDNDIQYILANGGQIEYL